MARYSYLTPEQRAEVERLVNGIDPEYDEPEELHSVDRAPDAPEDVAKVDTILKRTAKHKR